MDKNTVHDKQVSDNFDAFQKILPSIVDEHRGEYAVLHDGEIVKISADLTEAVKFGRKHYGRMYSLQEIDDVIHRI